MYIINIISYGDLCRAKRMEIAILLSCVKHNLARSCYGARIAYAR